MAIKSELNPNLWGEEDCWKTVEMGKDDIHDIVIIVATNGDI